MGSSLRGSRLALISSESIGGNWEPASLAKARLRASVSECSEEEVVNPALGCAGFVRRPLKDSEEFSSITSRDKSDKAMVLLWLVMRQTECRRGTLSTWSVVDVGWCRSVLTGIRLGPSCGVLFGVVDVMVDAMLPQLPALFHLRLVVSLIHLSSSYNSSSSPPVASMSDKVNWGRRPDLPFHADCGLLSRWRGCASSSQLLPGDLQSSSFPVFRRPRSGRVASSERHRWASSVEILHRPLPLRCRCTIRLTDWSVSTLILTLFRGDVPSDIAGQGRVAASRQNWFLTMCRCRRCRWHDDFGRLPVPVRRTDFFDC